MPQYIRQPISVGNLLLDVGNFRIVKQESQKAARDAIIAEEGPTPFQRFDTLMRRIIKVPKAVVDRRADEAKKERQKRSPKH